MTVERPASRSYARTYARVALNSTSSVLEEGATATRRLTREEMRTRMASAPSFVHPSPDESLLGELVAGYEHITGDAVRRPRKRNLVAACYRVHGDEFLPLVARRFASTGTATNLLGDIRCLPLMEPAKEADDPPRGAIAATLAPPPDLAPGLTYPADAPPRFDPTSKRRYDRRRSNPDAAAFFSDDDLGVPSPTARALSR